MAANKARNNGKRIRKKLVLIFKVFDEIEFKVKS